MRRMTLLTIAIFMIDNNDGGGGEDTDGARLKDCSPRALFRSLVL